MGFCSNCGAQVPDGVAVCPACGASMGAPANNAQQVQYNQAAYGQPAYGQQQVAGAQVIKKPNPISEAWKNAEGKMGATKLFGICVGVVVLILLLFVAGCANSYKSPINKYMKGMKKYNAEKMYKAYDEDLADEMGIDEDSLEERMEYLEDADIEVKSYKIVAARKLSKDDVKDFADGLDDFYGYDKHISKVYQVVVRVERDEDGTLVHNDMTFAAYKTGLKWYIAY